MSVSVTETMVQDFWEFGQVPKWDIRVSKAADFENMTDLEHMLLPFLNFSHKCVILMLHLWQIVFLLHSTSPVLYSTWLNDASANANMEGTSGMR